MTATVPATVDQREPQLRLRALFDRGTLRLLAPEDDSVSGSGIAERAGNRFHDRCAG